MERRLEVTTGEPRAVRAPKIAIAHIVVQKDYAVCMRQFLLSGTGLTELIYSPIRLFWYIYHQIIPPLLWFYRLVIFSFTLCLN